MSQDKEMNRRKFLTGAGATIAGAALLTKSKMSFSADLPELKETDPIAKGIKYVAKADANNRNTNAKANGGVNLGDQLCSNCAQYTPKADGKGTCNIVAGKLVQGAGWCVVWVPAAKKK